MYTRVFAIPSPTWGHFDFLDVLESKRLSSNQSNQTKLNSNILKLLYLGIDVHSLSLALGSSLRVAVFFVYV